MGSYLDKPETTKNSANSENQFLDIGSSSMQGWRVNQEDAHNSIPDYSDNISFFGVYDGHGGAEVAEYCSNKLPDFLKALDSFKNGNYEEALKEAFLKFDQTLLQENVIQELREIAKKNPDYDSELEDDGEEETAEEIISLHQEAAMPLKEVLEKYNRNSKTKTLKADKQEQNISKSNTLNSEVNDTKQCSESEVSSSKPSTDSNEPSSTSLLSSCASASDHPDTTTSSLPSSSKTPESSKSGHSSTNLSHNIASISSSSSHSAETSGGCTSTSNEGPSSSNSAVLCSKERTVDTPSTSDDDDLDDENFKESQFENKKADDDVNDSSDEDDDDEEIDHDNEELDDEEELSNEELSGEEDEDDFISNMEIGPGKASGCTAVVALLANRDLYVANVGDSRCVLCRGGKVVEMSFDHKPEDDIEFQRIKKAGGRVTLDGRVNGGLNLSRAIGDHGYKMNKDLPIEEQLISPLPDIKKITLQPDDEFMVLACDGVWNYMSNEEVVGFVKHRIDSGKYSLSSICEELFHNCLAPNTLGDGTGCDNMTAIIVRFKPTLFELATSSNNQNEVSLKRAHEVMDGENNIDDVTKKQKVEDDIELATTVGLSN